jgi:hypothetical protein
MSFTTQYMRQAGSPVTPLSLKSSGGGGCIAFSMFVLARSGRLMAGGALRFTIAGRVHQIPSWRLMQALPADTPIKRSAIPAQIASFNSSCSPSRSII